MHLTDGFFVLNTTTHTRHYLGMSECDYTDEHGTQFWFADGNPRVFHREDGPAVVRIDGSWEWYFKGKCHREDGPAVRWVDGTLLWFVSDRLHREDGPAIECPDGSQQWLISGKLHRTDGPAVINDGAQMWFYRGHKHRIDGPAVIYTHTLEQEWFVNDKLIGDRQSFQLAANITPEQLIAIILKHGDIS